MDVHFTVILHMQKLLHFILEMQFNLQRKKLTSAKNNKDLGTEVRHKKMPEVYSVHSSR